MQNKNTSNSVFIVDLLDKTSGWLPADAFQKFSERHFFELSHSNLMRGDNDLLNKIKKTETKNIVFILHEGIASKSILKLSKEALSNKINVYYYWPKEEAIEVIDEIRYKSMVYLRRIYILANLLSKLYFSCRLHLSKININYFRRLLVVSRIIIKNIIMSRTPLGNNLSRVLNTKIPHAGDKIRGRGLYMRLDYWVNIISGGSYGHTCFVARSLRDITENFKCIVAQPYALLDDYGVDYDVVGGGYSASDSLDLIINARAFRTKIEVEFDANPPAYVYERLVLGSSIVAEICARRGIPYIAEYNGSEMVMARTFGAPNRFERVFNLIESAAFNVASVINVVSEPVATSLEERGVQRSKILVNPNGVDPKVYKPLDPVERVQVRLGLGLSPSDIVVGFSGTFGGWHGIEVLAAGLPRICSISPHVRFLVIGDGDRKHLISKAIADHNLEARVVDVGRVPQLTGAKYLGTADILVATHAQNIGGREFFGSPTKLFEYMSVGAGVVCSDLAQLGEVMRPSLSSIDFIHGLPDAGDARGLLVEPGNVDDYVWAVEQLVRNRELRLALGRNARAAVIDNYTWDIHVENIWRHLAGEPLRGYFQDRNVGLTSGKKPSL